MSAVQSAALFVRNYVQFQQTHRASMLIRLYFFLFHTHLIPASEVLS